MTSYQCSAPYAEPGNDAYMMITIVCQYPPGLHTQETYHNGVERTECSFWVIGNVQLVEVLCVCVCTMVCVCVCVCVFGKIY